jgi:Na+/proline symporter
MDPLFLGILAYVAVQIAIGVWVSRRIRTEDDYLVAGRRMGPWLATGTIFATWFGAETCVGASGDVYANGITLATAEPCAYGLCIVLMGAVFAGVLWRRRITTLADLFRERFSPGVERLAALVMIPTSLLWAAAQVRAFGQVIAATSELEIETAVAVAASLAIVYTAFGGLLADAITDIVQGACLVAGLGAIAFGVFGDLGGGVLGHIDASQVRALPAGVGVLDLCEAWAVPILGSVVAQELVARISASRSERVARGSALVAGAIYVLVGLVPVTLGLVGAGLIPGLEDPEEILPALARAQLGPVLFVLFAGALVSAILSTVDSTLLVSSSLLAHNVILPLRGPTSERTKVRLARAGVVAFGVVAWLLALHAEGVHALVEEASSLGSAGILVILVLGLFTRAGGAVSAYAAVLGGLVVYLAATYGGYAWPYLLSLAAALLGYAAPLAFGRGARSQASRVG